MAAAWNAAALDAAVGRQLPWQQLWPLTAADSSAAADFSAVVEAAELP